MVTTRSCFVLVVTAILLSAGSATAQMPQIGRGDVMQRATADAVAQCLFDRRGSVEAGLTCLDRPDVSDGARALARAVATETSFGMVGLLRRFTETGNVDIAQVVFPAMANTNWQTVLVNGEGPPRMAAELNFRRTPPSVAGTRAIRARYPQAFESGRVSISAVRMMPGGTQLFVLTDVVTDGCRACEPVAQSVRYHYFTNGRYDGLREIGWQPLFTLEDQTAYFEALVGGDVALLQARLNELGYDAGRVDGQAGPQTRAALGAFRRDYCLPQGGRVGREDFNIMGFTRDVYAGADCAPEQGASPPDLPFDDGVYAADPRLCPPVAEEGRAELGDRAHGLAVRLDGALWFWGESRCTIRDAGNGTGRIGLALDCTAEGRSFERDLDLFDVSAEGFTLNGRAYRACTTDGAPDVHFPLSGPEVRITANFAAHGAGPLDDPDAYFAGQFHVATDIAARAGRTVVAPVDGDVVYYHRRGNKSADPLWMQSFVVFRDREGRDWIFGHVACTVCEDHPPVGDADTWPDSHVVRDIRAGTQIGRIANLAPEGGGNHLHLGLSTQPIVETGQLLAPYHGGNWARLTYPEGVEGAVDAVAAEADRLGFIDPMRVLPHP